jgi:hypothetical protein
MNLTTVEDVHEKIGDTAVRYANDVIAQNARIAKKYRVPALRNGVPYNDGRLVLEIASEYQGVPEGIKIHYRLAATEGLAKAIQEHSDLFVGSILGEAKEGRNYFNRWPQAPSQLF